MASTAYAMKALAKVTSDITRTDTRVEAIIGNHLLSFWDQNGRITCLRVRRITDRDDSMSDYCAGWFPRSLKDGIDSAVRAHQQDLALVAEGRRDAASLGLS